jgi:hypothetical protein
MERMPGNAYFYREQLMKSMGDRPVHPQLVVRFARHVVRGLEYLHDKKIVHRYELLRLQISYVNCKCRFLALLQRHQACEPSRDTQRCGQDR